MAVVLHILREAHLLNLTRIHDAFSLIPKLVAIWIRQGHTASLRNSYLLLSVYGCILYVTGNMSEQARGDIIHIEVSKKENMSTKQGSQGISNRQKTPRRTRKNLLTKHVRECQTNNRRRISFTTQRKQKDYKETNSTAPLKTDDKLSDEQFLLLTRHPPHCSQKVIWWKRKTSIGYSKLFCKSQVRMFLFIS